MKLNKLFLSLILLSAIFSTACNNDDEPKAPNNALALNMMAGDESTTITGSDVYINESLNFTSDNYGLSDLGRRGSLTINPVTSQLAQEVAVSPGDYYQIINPNSLGTVAGMRVFCIDRSYCNVYVESWIHGADKSIVGAKVKYAECYPKDKNLPEWDSTIPVRMKVSEPNYTASYSFPKGCVIDDNIVVYDQKGYYDFSGHLKVKIEGNKISFSYPLYMSYPWPAKVVMLVRHESLYTRVALTFDYPVYE